MRLSRSTILALIASRQGVAAWSPRTLTWPSLRMEQLRTSKPWKLFRGISRLAMVFGHDSRNKRRTLHGWHPCSYTRRCQIEASHIPGDLF